MGIPQNPDRGFGSLDRPKAEPPFAADFTRSYPAGMSIFTTKSKAPKPLPDIYQMLTRKRTFLQSDPLPPVSNFLKREQEMWRDLDGKMNRVELAPYVDRDPCPIPPSAEREDYFADDHAGYWFMGLRDYLKVEQAIAKHSQASGPAAVLDLGCSSGRLLRHFAAHMAPETTVWGADIAIHNVDWVRRNLPERIRVFQNSIYPHLPLPDASMTCVTAFSVFTHIDTFDDTWLLELRRLLKPGGIAYVTVHTERVWERVADNPSAYAAMDRCRKHTPDWDITPELFRQPMPQDRIVFHWSNTDAYRCNTFETQESIRRRWGRFFEVCEIYDGGVENYQDIAILRRRDD